MEGRGTYCVDTEIEDSKVTRNLLARMGGLADGVGDADSVEFH